MKRSFFVLLLAGLFFFASGFNNAQVTVSLPNAVGSPGTSNFLPVTVSSLTGLNVYAFQFQINYDPNIISITAFNVNGAIISTDPLSAVDSVNGYIRFVWAAASPISGAGTLLNIRIRYKNAGATALTFDNTFQTKFQTLTQDLTVTRNNGNATVSTTNNPPVFDSVQPKSVNENQSLTFTVNATDPEGLPITYTTGTLPQGASFNASTRTFTWTPNYNQQGNYTVRFFASDGSNSDTLDVAITVVNVNRAPSLNLNQNGPFTINENQSLTIQLTGSDPDQNAVLTYSGSSLPTGAAVTKNNNTSATFSWTPGANQSGSYSFSLTVMDEFNAADSKTVQITVIDVSTAPVLTFNPLPPFSINEGVILDIQLIGTDPDAGSTLKFSATNLPSGATLGETTGLFSWTPQFNQAGQYVVTFKVTDETNLSDSRDVTITVNNVNRAPVFLVRMTSRTVQVHNVPVEFKFQYEGLDPDSDQLYFNLVNGPVGSSINSSGLFKWAPYTNQAGQQFDVIVELSDGSIAVKDTTKLTASSTITGVDQELGGIPDKFSLAQNFPNPFNPSTVISYSIPEESFVQIKVFSLIGEEIATLVEDYKSPGNYKVNFEAKNLHSGIYLYQLKANNFTSIRKMIVVK